MANGSHKEGPASGDRLREKFAKFNRRTQLAMDAERDPALTHPPGSEPYRAEMDSVSEMTIGKEGVRVKSRAPWLQFAISLLIFLAFVAWLFKR